MQKRVVIAVGALVVIAIGAAVALGAFSTPPALPAPSEARYTGQGVSFAYPNVYTLTSRADGFEELPLTVLTFVPKDAVIPDASEGPPGISVLIMPNPLGMALGDWVQAKSISNFQLSPDKELTPTRVGGEEGVAYTYSGLYENDAVAVAHAGKIYLFFGAWGAATDPIRTDFKNLLSSVTFIE